MIRVRFKVGKDVYYPGEEVDVAKAFARFVIHHGYAELADESVCPECFAKVIGESGCVTCRECGWSRCG